MKPRFSAALLSATLCFGLSACSTAARAPANETQNTATPHSPAPKRAAPLQSAARCTAVRDDPRRASCFHLSPGGTGGMCQPQSIPYARCRTGFSSCELGNTSPVQWFNCERKRGYTSSVPRAGSLMALNSNMIHHMGTGHTLFVEEVCPNPDGTFKLRVSHTNYDRRCHLEEDAWVEYDPRAMVADFSTGHWAAWAKHMKVQGFILAEPAPANELPPLATAEAAPERPAHPALARRKAAAGAKAVKHKPAIPHRAETAKGKGKSSTTPAHGQRR